MRPDVDSYFIDMAKLVASRSTCVRRSVGCVLVDERNHVLATGYNGPPAGSRHCNELALIEGVASFPNACAGATSQSGTNLDACSAVHAEQNAILQCIDAYAIAKAYVTTFPCSGCAKLLLNTSCREVVYLEAYGDSNGMRLWLENGRLARQFAGEPPMIQRDIVRFFGEGDSLNEWRIVVACMCLNVASARVARRVVMRLLSIWPDPTSMAGAGDELETLLRPLGLADRRAAYLRCLGDNYGLRPLEAIPGVGPYAIESVRVFAKDELPAELADSKVAAWVAWRRSKQITK